MKKIPDDEITLRLFDWRRLKRKINLSSNLQKSYITVYSILFGIGGAAALSIIPILLAPELSVWWKAIYIVSTFFCLSVAIIFLILGNKHSKNYF